jgi:Reverse transcriptase (RNA-dependent DNA polymerase)
LQTLTWETVLERIRSHDLLQFVGITNTHIDWETNTVDWTHPFYLSARANSEDNPTWEEAMNGPDRAGYWKSMEKELQTLDDEKRSWDVVMQEPWMNVLPSTWAFRCKHYPDGTIRKLKARFCARADKQIEGVDYFDTFAPVVNWTTVRLMLVLSIILKLATKEVDYTAAFVHADIDRDPNWDNMTEEERQRSGVYVRMPRRFSQPGKVLKLNKSLHGLKQAPRNFFLHFKAKLERISFTSMTYIDPCLFISQHVICLVYVDDTLFYSPKEEYIQAVIEQLK